MPQLKIAPSVLSADLGNLNAEIKSIEDHSDLIHFDVMDGHFVPNLSMGAPIAACIKSKLPLDCHLMISNPEKYIDDYAKVGANSISVHVEIKGDIGKIIQQIKSHGIKASLAVKPATPIEAIEPYLNQLDMVLIMSVEPGFSGQKFMDICLPKIKWVRERKPEIDIEVDGGISDQTAPLVKKAGANVLVSASYIFGAKNRIDAIFKLRQ